MSRKKYEKESSICNCLNIRRASQAVTQIYDEYLEPSGLKVSQFSLLKHIKILAPVSVSNLALKMRLDRTTLVRNIKTIEKKELIEDTSLPGSRDRQLELTEKGINVLEIGEHHWNKAQEYIMEYMGRDELATLVGLLSKIEALVP